MKFAEPVYFHLVWLVLGLAVVFLWSGYARKKSLARLAEPDLLARLAPARSPGRQLARVLLLLLGVALVAIAVARPQWGLVEEEVKQKGVDLILVVDTSLSMLAQDVKPSRLERSRLELKEFLANLHGDRGGLVVFSSTAHMLVPLTMDVGVIEMFLDVLDTEITSGRGTAVAEALETALEALPDGDVSHTAILLVSDGENHGGEPIAIAKKAAERGVVIHTIGVGTPEGEPIPVRDPFRRGVTYKTDRSGQVITTKLQEETMKRIAAATGGRYIRLGVDRGGMATLWDDLASMEERELEGRLAKRYKERFQWPLAAGLLFFLGRLAVPGSRRSNFEAGAQ